MSVSIVIPSYNSAAFLAAAVESALRQTVPAERVVVVDDGSTDNTSEVCQTFAEHIDTICVPNGGVSKARNLGASYTKSKWLLFLDADDRLLPNALEHLIARSRQGDFGVVHGRSIYFDEDNGTRVEHGVGKSEGPVPAATAANFWKSAITTPGAAIIRRDVFTKVGGFSPHFDTLADRDFWIKAGMVNEFGFYPGAVIEKRVHATNMSGNIERALQQAAEVQLGFLQWCADRQLSTAFLRTSPSGIMDNLLRKALRVVSLGGLHAVLKIAREKHLNSVTIQRARFYAKLPPRISRLILRLRSFVVRH